MQMFPDADGEMRLREAELAQQKERERREAEEATLIVEGDEPEDSAQSALDSMKEEMQMLEKDLEEALQKNDFETADHLQSLIDELEAKMSSSDSFARLPSVHEDQSIFSIRVEVLRCNGLVPSSKKPPTLSPYVCTFLSRRNHT